MQRITVTVLENATIFEAEEQVHRYDLPCSGILAGWAVAAVVEQIKVIADGRWPDIEVAISGNDRAVEVLSRTLLNKGVAAYDAEALEEDDADEFLPLTRPTSGKTKIALPRPNMLHIAVGVVIMLVLGVSWWGIDVTSQPIAKGQPVQEPEQHSANDAGIVVEFDRVRVKLPVGYRLGPREDGLLVATGQDPELRILIAIDPVYGVDAGVVRTEIAAMVAEDPSLTEQPSRNLRPAEPTVEYQEQPGDGSTVHWVAWVAKEHQFSVGCHSKAAVSASQRGACKMAVESLDFK